MKKKFQYLLASVLCLILVCSEVFAEGLSLADPIVMGGERTFSIGTESGVIEEEMEMNANSPPDFLKQGEEEASEAESVSDEKDNRSDISPVSMDPENGSEESLPESKSIQVVSGVQPSVSTIAAKKFSVRLSPTSYVYDGKPHRPSAAVTLDGKTILSGNYTVTYSHNTDPGFGLVRVKGKGMYANQDVYAYFSIAPQAPVQNAPKKGSDGKSITVSWNAVPKCDGYTVKCYSGTAYGGSTNIKTVNGASQTSVTFSGLKPGTTYTTELTAVKKAHLNEIGVSGSIPSAKSNTKSIALPKSDSGRIEATVSKDLTVKVLEKTMVYTGKERRPSIQVYYGTTLLKQGTHYGVSYQNNIKVGTGKIAVSGIGSYAGYTGSATFTIEGKNFSAKLAKNTFVYNEEAQKPAVTVTNNGRTLESKYYKLSYKNNIHPGMAYVVVKGAGDYSGSEVKLPFYISPPKMTLSSVKSASGENKISLKWMQDAVVDGYEIQYSTNKLFSSDVKKKIVTDVSAISETLTGLTKGKTYYVRIRARKDAFLKEFAGAKKTLNGQWSDVKSATAGSDGSSSSSSSGSGSSSKKSLSVTLKNEVHEFSGKAVKPSVTVKSSGNKLNRLQYSVSYSDNDTPGRATVTVEGKGTYKGMTGKAYFYITPGAVDTPKAEMNLKKKTIDVSWGVMPGADGAKVQYSTVQSFKTGVKTKTVTGDKRSVTLSDLETGRVYYIRVCGYLNVYSRTENGTWSTPAVVEFTKGGEVASEHKKLTVSVSSNRMVYTGSPLEPSVTVKYGKTKLDKDDYKVSYSNNTKVGTAKITVKGKGDYEGYEGKATFKIIAKTRSSSKSLTVIVSKKSLTYTGEALKPPVRVKVGKTVLDKDEYKVTYKNNTDIGTAKVVVTGKGSYKGYKGTATFKIKEDSGSSSGSSALKKLTVVVDEPLMAYTGEALKPSVTVRYKTKTLKESQYKVSYKNNIDVGMATVKVTGKGTYKGYTGEASFEIAVMSSGSSDGSSDPGSGGSWSSGSGSSGSNTGSSGSEHSAKWLTVTLSKTSMSYTGKALKPSVTVKSGNKKLKKGTDYKVSYKNNVEVGTATVTVTGKGKYKGYSGEAYFMIAWSSDGSSSSILNVTLAKKSMTYTGRALKPSVTVKIGDKTLKEGTEYKVSYKNNTKIGTATVTVTGQGIYKGFKGKASFKIKASSKMVATVSKTKLTYNGKTRKPSVTVVYKDKKLSSGDYSVSYKSNKKPGKATVTVKGKGKYKGKSAKDTFYIRPKKVPVVSADTSFEKKTLRAYWKKIEGADGYKITLSTDANFASGNVSKKTSGKSSTEYTFKNMTPGATYYVKVCAFVKLSSSKNLAGDWSGTTTIVFPTSATSGSVTTEKTLTVKLAETAVTYTGSALKPAATVTCKDKTLKEGTDYTIAYENNTEVGTATVKVTGKGDYKGYSGSATFTIKAKELKAEVIGVDGVLIYTGKALQPSVKVTSSGKEVDPKYYTVTYWNNINPGAATVTVTGKDLYDGCKAEAVFYIAPQTPSITEAVRVPEKNEILVKWTRIANAQGYRVMYSTDPNFTTNRTKEILSPSVTQTSLQSLEAGATYYIRILSTKNAVLPHGGGARIIYGLWSDAVKVELDPFGDQPGTETETETETVTESGTEPGTETETENQTETESQTETEAHAQTQQVAETGAETESEVEILLEAEPDSETETESETSPETESETVPGNVTETEAVLETAEEMTEAETVSSIGETESLPEETAPVENVAETEEEILAE